MSPQGDGCDRDLSLIAGTGTAPHAGMDFTRQLPTGSVSPQRRPLPGWGTGIRADSAELAAPFPCQSYQLQAAALQRTQSELPALSPCEPRAPGFWGSPRRVAVPCPLPKVTLTWRMG